MISFLFYQCCKVVSDSRGMNRGPQGLKPALIVALGPAYTQHQLGTPMVPASGDARSHHHFEDFRKHKPVEAVSNRERYRVREHG